MVYLLREKKKKLTEIVMRLDNFKLFYDFRCFNKYLKLKLLVLGFTSVACPNTNSINNLESLWI